MPIDSKALGMNSRWFKEALESAEPASLGEGRQARVITVPMFLATKLAAFHDRGHGDLLGSHDLEDIVTVIDGCTGIVQEVSAAPADVREFIAHAFSDIIQHGDFDDAVFGHLSAAFGRRENVSAVKDKFIAISAST